MRILDLQSLRDAIREELNRFTESDDTIDGFIQRAEARIKRLQSSIDRATTQTVPMTPGESEVDFVALATNVEIVKPLSAAIIGTDDGTGFEAGTNPRDRRQFRITHKADIEMLIGASNAFVRRPFLWTGFWYGLLGGACALALVQYGLYLLEQPVSRLAGLYQGSISVTALSLAESSAILGVAVFLGLFASWVTAARHMRRIEPR